MVRDTHPRAPRRALRLPALAALVGMLTSGCLGHYYEVSRPEMERLVQTPPEQRGQNVYALQQFSTADEPEPLPAWPTPEGEPPPGYTTGVYSSYWIPNFYVGYGEPAYHAPAPPAVPPTAASAHSATPVGKASSSGGSHSSGGSVGNLNGVDKLLVAAIVVGVAVGVALAVTEGLRYEGTLAVHPHHPVHLWYRNAQYTTIALDELRQEDLRGLERATLAGPEGAGMWLREAAPLNRQGFSYQLGMGNDNLALPGHQNERGAGFRFALGYYPTQKFGLLLDSRIQLRDTTDSSLYNVRLGLEAQWYPLVLWRLHLGPFVGGGQTWSATGGAGLPSTQGPRPYVAFGALAEFALTTRLGLVARWNEDWLPTAGASTQRLNDSWSVGFAIY